MTTFVFIPGAGGVAWYWHRVVPLLEEAQHEAIAVDLPGDDEQASLSAYADRVLEAIGTRRVVLVAQSLGGFTAPLVCARAPVRVRVFVNAMIPVPGETAGEWWDNTGSIAARIAAAKRGGYSTDFDLATYFLHDLPAETIRQGEAARGRDRIRRALSIRSLARCSDPRDRRRRRSVLPVRLPTARGAGTPARNRREAAGWPSPRALESARPSRQAPRLPESRSPKFSEIVRESPRTARTATRTNLQSRRELSPCS
jgi:pimeloyl-ACP methyl ester carboxylesterase